jgi:hypothetical protein
LAFTTLYVVASCGGTLPPPKRRVIESDVGDWHFRRYQKTVDVEVYVNGNPAVAHTASYLRVEAEKTGKIKEGDLVSVFVTEYKSDKGVGRALVKFARRLAQEAGYVVEETDLGGQRVFRVAGHGETWAFWSSGRFVIKVGGPGVEKLPSGLVKEYGRRYPSKVKDGSLDAPQEEEDDDTADAGATGGKGAKGKKADAEPDDSDKDDSGDKGEE